VIRSKSWTRVLDRAGHQVGSENYGLDYGFFYLSQHILFFNA